jgi:hypothetical protein
MLATLLSTLKSALDAAAASAAASGAEEVRRWVSAYTGSLPRVPRFTTVVLFMSGAERNVAKQLLEGLGEDAARVQGWDMVLGR